jgi:hypothetical protein
MNLNGILIGSEDPRRLTEYYTRLFVDFQRLEAAGATVVQEPYRLVSPIPS